MAIVGRSGAGKTRLICLLIPEFRKKGLEVGTLKHDVHGFEMDREGKDTWRHREAGAKMVSISSKESFAIIGRTEGEIPPLALVERFPGDVDIVLIEGFKRHPFPKIEVLKKGEPSLCGAGENLLAFVACEKFRAEVPVFTWEEPGRVAEFVLRSLGVEKGGGR